jgi:hypothetical protein
VLATPSTGDFLDPNWEPSDEHHAALTKDFLRTVQWRKEMITVIIPPMPEPITFLSAAGLSARGMMHTSSCTPRSLLQPAIAYASASTTLARHQSLVAHFC